MQIDDEESHPDSTHPLHDGDNVVSSSKRCPVVEAKTPKSTSSERNKRSRLQRSKLVGIARELMKQDLPLPLDVQKAYDYNEREKKRSRENHRNKRALEKMKIGMSEQQKKPCMPATTSRTAFATPSSNDMSTFMSTFPSALGDSCPSPSPYVPPFSPSCGAHLGANGSIGPPPKSVSLNIPDHLPKSSPVSLTDKMVDTHGLRSFSEKAVGPDD